MSPPSPKLPASPEALARLLEEIETIDAQLADPDKRSASGARLSAHDYRKWRAGAIRAKHIKSAQYRAMKRELAKQ